MQDDAARAVTLEGLEDSRRRAVAVYRHEAWRGCEPSQDLLKHDLLAWQRHTCGAVESDPADRARRRDERGELFRREPIERSRQTGVATRSPHDGGVTASLHLLVLAQTSRHGDNARRKPVELCRRDVRFDVRV